MPKWSIPTRYEQILKMWMGCLSDMLWIHTCCTLDASGRSSTAMLPGHYVQDAEMRPCKLATCAGSLVYNTNPSAPCFMKATVEWLRKLQSQGQGRDCPFRIMLHALIWLNRKLHHEDHRELLQLKPLCELSVTPPVGHSHLMLACGSCLQDRGKTSMVITIPTASVSYPARMHVSLNKCILICDFHHATHTPCLAPDAWRMPKK